MRYCCFCQSPVSFPEYNKAVHILIESGLTHDQSLRLPIACSNCARDAGPAMVGLFKSKRT
jgi:hypothetical protein